MYLKFRRFLCKIGLHWWTYFTPYYNPYRRECTHCKRLEVSYCQSLDTWNRSWWECHNEGIYDNTK